MIKKLLLFLVLLLMNFISFSQGAEIKGNCLYDNTTKRITVRLALRNPTGSPAPIQLAGMRFGIQYNPLAVNYAGFTSYMHNSTNQGLNVARFLDFIGPDTNAPNGFSWESPATRNATVTSNNSVKVLNRIYINRSTDNCFNANVIGSNQMKVLIDIYFTLVNDNPAYYHLNEPGEYGWGDPEFIAQFLTKDNGGHTGNLTDPFKEIAIVIIRQGNTGNPYQPFDFANAGCSASGNPNPIVVNGSNVNFINPVNGVLSGKVSSLDIAERNDHVVLNWNVENNEFADHYEIERKDENGNFRTIGLIMGDNKNATTSYQFKDKITTRDVKMYYRVKLVGSDRVVSYSDIKMIRPSGTQQQMVKMFPNPATDVVRFHSPLLNGQFICRVYSTEGRMVLAANANAVNPNFGIGSLVSGVYFVEMYHPQSGKRFYSQFNKK